MDTDRYERKKKFREKFAPRYDQFIIRLKRTCDALLGRIGPYLDSSKSVLEIATGTGVVALAIAPGVRMVRACDISGEMVRIVRDKLRASGLDNVEFDAQDACCLNYQSESFAVGRKTG
jgi:ubiquinone/menaquinone biosynthesis C-methylase UbiE